MSADAGDGTAPPPGPALVNSAGERRDRIIYKVVLTGGERINKSDKELGEINFETAACI